MSNKEVFKNIEEKLNKEFIGQKNFFSKLCGYFREKISNDEKGILLLVGSKDTFKKASVRFIFQELKESEVIKNGEVDDIDLSEYSFNLGYNAFLTDLYEKLNNDSKCIIFKNTDMASEEILSLLSKIRPNSCLPLKNEYILKNKFMIEAEANDNTEKINAFLCHNKFFVFVYNNDNDEKFNQIKDKYLKNSEEIFYTKDLTKEERDLVIKAETIREIRKIQDEFNIEAILEIKEDSNKTDDYLLCTYLQDFFREDVNFDVKQYVSYKVYKPLRNLIINQGLQDENKILIYVEENEIYCKTNKEIYKLSEYSIPTLEEARYKLDSIIGIDELKEFIQNVENNYKVQEIRERLGLKSSMPSLNMIFAGNAGTGKTNAARVTFEYLNALGILRKCVFKEVSKADFITENPSDAAKRTNDIINSALGGVLFIDEAYSLCQDENDKVGKEIVDALLKGIEDNRNDLVVIIAGYEKDIEKFLKYNQGLSSRFPNTIHFHDYDPKQMYEIAVNIAKSKGYTISEKAKSGLIELFTKNQLVGKNDLGNARFVRNIVENAILDSSKKYLTNKERSIDVLERDNFNFKAKAKFNLEEKLKGIIGLDEVKELLRSQYKLLVAQEKRKSVGVNTKIEQNLNMVFAGNPGTGKTSIARLVAEMLNSMGLLKGGQLVETDRSSFVSDIPGQTAKKTEEKFKEAIGGILFIDEAYTLANDDLGREAVETLLKLIEDYSKEVIVILAGYEEEMEDFFDVNIGLKSRFPLWTTFQDYNPNELLEMSIKLIESSGFKLSKNAYVALKNSFVDIYKNSDATSGNGRMVRNYVERLIRNQSIRIAEEDISVYEMNLITTKDIEKINVSDYDNKFNLEKKLDGVISNENAKNFLREQYKFMKVMARKKGLGMATDLNKYMNIIAMGSEGTGKKRTFNIYTEMLYNLGIVKSKNMIIMDKYDIVNSFKGGRKLDEVMNKYVGKVVFVENAGLLLEEENHKEILNSLIKFIDSNYSKIIIVLSGDKIGVRNLIQTNQELSYRFPVKVEFKDYKIDELLKIALTTLSLKGYNLNDDVKEKLEETLIEIYADSEVILKNGLLINQFLDCLIRTQSIRICDENFNNKEINIITVEDIEKSKTRFLQL